jgi:hypothetical protein
VNISVDAASGQHAIDPNIYGVAFADTAALTNLNVPLNRSGGNATSRYNWQLNATNHASDYFFESIAESSSTPGADGDSFISSAKVGGAQASLTIPTIGWVAKLGSNRGKLASFSVAKYGPQQSTDPYLPDAGNGVKTDGTDITGNDPNDANQVADVNFQKAWVQHLISQWGLSSAGGLRYYTMDNEPSIWHQTHRDVHPTGASMDEIRNDVIAYATMIKSLDPGALILGPEEWGWTGYLYSGLDQQYGAQHGWSGPFPDKSAHNNMDYLPYLLDQWRQASAQAGKRLLDYFTVHFYPQGGEFGNDVSTNMQLLRNRSTRALWDANYVDESWINTQVDLIPRLKNWVATYYPGTKIGITEYNWGAENHMNGATTQADILGIFGQQGLDLANRWTTPAAGTPAYNAIKMYRNYDGNKSTFGNTSVTTSVPNPDQVSAFSAIRTSDNTLTIMVINKNLYDPANPSATTSITVNVSNFQNLGVAQEWQLAAINPTDMTKSAVAHLSDLSFNGSSFTISVPMQSVEIFVIKGGQIVAKKLSSITGRAGQNGQWWVGQSTGSSFANGLWATWNPAVNWVNVQTGDFNGDGKADIIGRDLQSGNWWVGLSNGSAFATTLWTNWNPSVTWVDVKVADFNGDGKADIAGRVAQTGQWWIGLSTGSSFTNSLWATWSAVATWVDVNAGDFNGDAKADITGRYLQGGSWWTSISSGSSFTTTQWGTWSPAATWVDVRVGDFNGDGKADITGRYSQAGSWWTGISNGSSFTTTMWGSWNPNVTWVDVMVGDFNGDGKSDIIGRYAQAGQWFVGTSNNSSFSTSLWGTWNPAATWVDVRIGDFNGDGKADITGRYLQAGSWWTGLSSGSNFATSFWGAWSTGVTWNDIQAGVFN